MRFTPPDPTAPLGDLLNDPINQHPEAIFVLVALVVGVLFFVFRAIRGR